MLCLFLGFADVCLSVCIFVVNGILSFNISQLRRNHQQKPNHLSVKLEVCLLSHTSFPTTTPLPLLYPLPLEGRLHVITHGPESSSILLKVVTYTKTHGPFAYMDIIKRSVFLKFYFLFLFLSCFGMHFKCIDM